MLLHSGLQGTGMLLVSGKVLSLEENDALPKKLKRKAIKEAEIATDSPSSKFTYYFLQGKAQRKISAIHILDVLVLNGNDVRNQHFNQRYVGSGEVSFLYVSQSDCEMFFMLIAEC